MFFRRRGKTVFDKEHFLGLKDMNPVKVLYKQDAHTKHVSNFDPKKGGRVKEKVTQKRSQGKHQRSV